MDTKLRGNGERPEEASGMEKKPSTGVAKDRESFGYFEEELYSEKRKKSPVNSLMLLILGVLTTLFGIAGAMDISSYGEGARSRVEHTKLQQIMMASTNSAWVAQEEIIRYEKNLQRFFIHYDGFNPEATSAKPDVTNAELRRIQMEHEIIYQQAAREIMERYNPQISNIEEGLNLRGFYGKGEQSDSGEVWSSNGETVYRIKIYGEETRTGILEPELLSEYNEYLRLIKERDDLIAELAKKYLLTDEQAAEIIEQNIQENTVYDVSNYYEIKAYLEDTRFLRYCLKSSRGDSYITNIPEQDWAGYENPIRYVENGVDYFISVQDDCFFVGFNGRPLNEWFKNAGITGYILVTEPYSGNNPVSVYLTEKSYVGKIYNLFIIIVVISCIAAALIWTLFIKSDKATVKKAENAARRIYRKLPLIVKVGLFVGACISVILSVIKLNGICNAIYNRDFVSAVVPLVFLFLAATAGILYILICLGHLWELVKKPSMIANEPEIRLVMQLFKNVALVYGQHILSISLSMSFLITAYVLIQFAMIALILNRIWPAAELFLLCEVIINLLALYAFGLIVALAKTNRYMDAIISGDFDVEINEKGGYKSVINKLNRVRGGVRRVVVEKNNSEKMKTDLITNVSHDLKTPLTSIINYIELLKSPQLSEADRTEYIDILDSKTQRVKLLIDDLFEATKLSSGQIKLEKTTINIVDLLRQAVGELEEKFISAGISLKLTYSDESIPVAADGKKLWRVFENLFMNIFKYSQPGTRAYVSVNEKNGFAELVFKNISFYEMNFEYSELFERGKRGDVSRSTEGSGLGLSIAKDIVELHGGTMEIDIDGDLFKVTVKLPLE